jgi:transglutaminase-like putative cysteine protease
MRFRGSRAIPCCADASSPMRISLAHSTTFRYDGPVVLEPHVFRLRPREDGAQRLIQYQLDISPAPAGRSLFIDQDGNVAEQAWFNGPLRELSVRSMFQIETLRANPFDFLLPSPAALQLPLVYPAAERASLAPCLNESPEMAEFAKSVASLAAWQTMPFLDRLVRELFQSFEHVFREEGPPLSPQQTHRERRGSCRDLTVLFCAICRGVGLAARFVSGYETESAFQEDSNMHAWAEVYVPGGGWRGYDPARGVAVSTSHVAVAAAAESSLAAPIVGSYRGDAQAKMDFAISMQAG